MAAGGLQDPGVAYGREELQMQLTDIASESAEAQTNFLAGAGQRAPGEFGAGGHEIYVTFVEPIVVGPLGPWSLLKNGVEINAASPFAKFSPVVPYMNSM